MRIFRITWTMLLRFLLFVSNLREKHRAEKNFDYVLSVAGMFLQVELKSQNLLKTINPYSS